MIFYQIMSDDYEDGCRYVGTKKEALAEARACTCPATVHRVGIRDATKATILKLANDREWATPYEKIAEFNN